MLSVFNAILPLKMLKRIGDLQANETLTSYSQVRTKQLRSKRNGEPYLRLVLRDRSGQIEAKAWENVEEFNTRIVEGDFVKYQGTVEEYNGNKQLIVSRIRKVIPEDHLHGFSELEIIPRTEKDIEEMWHQLRTLVIDHTARPAIRQLLHNVLSQNEERIKSYPAGVEIHHNYWGGLLEHVLSILQGAVFFAEKYPGLDKDLLVAGAVLHDIGKLEELSGAGSPNYTVSGQLIGHVVLGYGMVRDEARKIADFPPDLLLLLEHLILSHQGQPEWGSPRRPQTREALILHYLDDLDAKLNRFERVLREDRGDSDFTAFDRHLGRALFKGEQEELPDRALAGC